MVAPPPSIEWTIEDQNRFQIKKGTQLCLPKKNLKQQKKQKQVVIHE